MRSSSTLGLAAVALTVVLAGCTPPTGQVSEQGMMNSEGAMMESDAMMKADGNPTTADAKIANAMSAAPAVIGKSAAVIDWPASETDTNYPELRKGTNGWTCLPDNPTSPGNDPICVDGNAMAWFQAYLKKETPTITQAGIGYMLQGGSDASNTDPFATEPAAGQEWMNAPAHIMLFPASDLDPNVYGIEMDGGPWIMWSGTPYEHLMVPVQ